MCLKGKQNQKDIKLCTYIYILKTQLQDIKYNGITTERNALKT